MSKKETYEIKRTDDGVMQCPCCEQPCGFYYDNLIYCATKERDVWLLQTNKHRFRVIKKTVDYFVCKQQ